MAKDKGLTLYEHVEALAVVDSWFDEALPEIEKAEGEVPEALVALLDLTTADFNEKVERVALKVNSYIAESAAIQAEADRLARRAKARAARAAYLKRYLHLCLAKANVAKVNGLLVNVRLQNSPPRVRCALTAAQIEALYHEEIARFSRSIVTRVPERYELTPGMVLTFHKNGAELPEGVTIEQGQHLRID